MFEYDQFSNITQLSGSENCIYTNPADKKSFIRLIILHNSSINEVNVILYKTPDGVVASVINQFYEELLPGKATRMIEFPSPGIILKYFHDSIWVKAETAGAINIYMSGGIE